MLAHAMELMEFWNGLIAINTRFNKLISSLRSGIEKREGTLDKEATSHDATQTQANANDCGTISNCALNSGIYYSFCR